MEREGIESCERKGWRDVETRYGEVCRKGMRVDRKDGGMEECEGKEWRGV